MVQDFWRSVYIIEPIISPETRRGESECIRRLKFYYENISKNQTCGTIGATVLHVNPYDLWIKY